MANSRYVASLASEELQAFREKLHSIQSGKCYICRKPIDLQLHEGSLELDHIEPLAVGGKDGFAPKVAVEPKVGYLNQKSPSDIWDLYT